MLFNTLSIDDWLTIESIQSSFISCLLITDLRCTDYYDFTDRSTALISWSQFISDTALRFIIFFREVDEFENLHAAGRFILIKYNIVSIFVFGKCYSYKENDDCCGSNDCESSRKQRQFFHLFDSSNTLHQSFVDIIMSLVHITEQDPIYASLLSIIFLFSRGLSINEEKPS
ncbi:hypothetical protein I4U23_022372 [Adineta vaga]|nr:hypothetical protein I4U23_022372 [Adineta vaga]